MRALPPTVAVACAAMLAAPGTAGAARLTFAPSDDASIRADRPSAPDGLRPSLRVGGVSPVEEAYLRFDVRVPEGSTVVSAAVYVRSLGPCGRTPLELRRVPDRAWSERTLAYGAAPRPGRVVDRVSGCLRGRWVRLDASRIIRSGGPVAVALTGAGPTRRFASREARAGRPRLLVRFRVADVAQPAGPPAATASPADPAAGAPRPPWRLVFDDEFDGSSLDTAKWTPEKWDGGSFYDPFNVLVSDGVLRLRARNSGSSAMVQTHGKLDFTYGRVEASVRVPRGQGFWPALWLRPSDPARAYPEIDLLEMWMTDRTDDVFDANTAWITYHWPDALGRNLQTNRRLRGPDDYTAGFHRFAMEWEPGEIRLYIDGDEKMRVDGPTVSSVPMFLIYSLQIGHADWIGDDAEPNSATPFPAYLEADYVRVYQR